MEAPNEHSQIIRGMLKTVSSNQAANYMKAAAVGAVTEPWLKRRRGDRGNTAAASSGAPAHYVPVTDADMLTLMSDGGWEGTRSYYR